MAKKPDPADDASLKRLGGGRWQTRDERFTIEPQSGTWVVVDAEQTDDLGLPLVRGPFSSLAAAKAAIADARTSEPATSPLAGRVARTADRPEKRGTDEQPRKPENRRAGERRTATDTGPEPRRTSEREHPAPEPVSAAGPARKAPEPPAEPGWISDLAAAERGRARRLIAALTEAGVADAEGIVRRDLVGGVPALAALAIRRRIADIGSGAHAADPAAIAAQLAEGRDDELGVRWRLVDGEGRPILIEAPARRRRG